MATKKKQSKLNGHTLLLEPFPEELLTMPGLAQGIADFAYERSSRDTRIPAIAAALLSVSILSAHQFIVTRRSGQATPLNLAVVLEMASGAGKENLRGTISAVLFAATSTEKLLDAAASGAALHREMASGGSKRIMLIDEFGRYLAAAKDDGHKGQLLSTMMSFLTAALGVVPPKLYANQKESLPAIHMPFLVFGGMTTKQAMDDALGSREVVDGFLNRMLIVRTDDVRPAMKPGQNTARLSPEMTEALHRLDALPKLPNGQEATKGHMPGYLPTGEGDPTVAEAFVLIYDELMRRIVPTEKAERELERIGKASDVEYVGGRGDPLTTLWARAGELVTRLAGVLALADAAVDEALMASTTPLPMTEAHVRWAERFVFWCVRNMIGVARTELHEGPEDKAQKKVLQAMESIVAEPPTGDKAKDRGWTEFNHKGWVPRAQLTERVRRNAPGIEQRTLKAALDSLETAGLLTVFDAADDASFPKDPDDCIELPEGLHGTDANEMRRRANSSKQLGAGLWYRLPSA